jgi:hypothetical protein
MNPKIEQNHQQYLKILSAMSPEQKLMKAFELSNLTKQLFLLGLRNRFPGKPESEIKKIYLERLNLCHNRNY